MEIDLLEEPINGFSLMISEKLHIWQEVMYENKIFYCTKCYHQGYFDVVCRVKKKAHDRSVKEKGLLN